MTDKNWNMKQTDFSSFPSEEAVQLDLDIQTGPELFADSFQIIDDLMKGSVPQGSFFAYLFRRFGYPQRGWDNYKELASYLLSTSRPDMLVRITPYAGGNPDLGITFLVSPEISSACREYPWRHKNAHRDAFGDWIEEKGIKPDWIDQWLDHVQKNPKMVPGPSPNNWKESLQDLYFIPYVNKQGKEHPWFIWMEETWDAYTADCPSPDQEYRTPDWRSWPDEDPLKAYAAAATETLLDLRRPVWVRDCPIDPWGPVEEDAAEMMDDANYHQAAGYPCGALGNTDPKGFSDLHGLILQLDPDNIENAIAAACNILSKATSDTQEAT